MSFNRHDLKRNGCMLTGSFRNKGYDWWWHSFTAISEETGEEVPFFVEFFLVNPGMGGKKPIFGQLPENKEKGIKPSYLMVKAGAWGKEKAQLHRFFGWQDVDVKGTAPYYVSASDCFASDTELRGFIEVTEEQAKAHPEWMSDAGSISFDLRLTKITAFNVGYGACGLFRAIKAYEMYWHAEGMKTEVSGTIEYNGKKYAVKPESSYGYADKNWGSNFTSPWVWLSSNNLKSRLTGEVLKDSVFDIGGGCPKIYFVALKRKLLSAFWYEGTPYEFNFSKFWTGTRTIFSSKETEDEIYWYVKQENLKNVMITEVKCKKSDMLLVNYESPDGRKRHNRLWNGGNGYGNVKLYRKKGRELILIDDIDVTNVGCEYGEYDK